MLLWAQTIQNIISTLATERRTPPPLDHTDTRHYPHDTRASICRGTYRRDEAALLEETEAFSRSKHTPSDVLQNCTVFVFVLSFKHAVFGHCGIASIFAAPRVLLDRRLLSTPCRTVPACFPVLASMSAKPSAYEQLHTIRDLGQCNFPFAILWHSCHRWSRPWPSWRSSRPRIDRGLNSMRLPMQRFSRRGPQFVDVHFAKNRALVCVGDIAIRQLAVPDIAVQQMALAQDAVPDIFIFECAILKDTVHGTHFYKDGRPVGPSPVLAMPAEIRPGLCTNLELRQVSEACEMTAVVRMEASDWMLARWAASRRVRGDTELSNISASVAWIQAFKAAGWNPAPAEISRAYSPPIPTAVTSEYFKAPPRSTALKDNGSGELEDEEEGGMVTGGGSHDTVVRRSTRGASVERNSWKKTTAATSVTKVKTNSTGHSALRT
ncbi:hypothetical protein MRB53_039251 [Persea americana]|nr:hypothetical protein MRB53_039251 [Persea americana]